MENEQKIIQKIETQRVYQAKLRQMISSFANTNPQAEQQCSNQLKQVQSEIDYLEEELRKLQQARLPADASHPPRTSSINPRDDASRKKFSNLDLLTSAVPYNTSKVSLKLHELEYKLDVENKMMAGIKNMERIATDKKTLDEVKIDERRCAEKVYLLTTALKKYKQLFIGEDESETDQDATEKGMPPAAYRRPVTGKLQLQIVEASELRRAPSRTIENPATVVEIKVDNRTMFRTRPSRSLRWAEECEVMVSKANEIEVCISDEGQGRSVPIGFLWLKISDIADGLRRQKVPQNFVRAEVAGQSDPSDQMNREGLTHQPSLVQKPADGDGLEAWFDVEPYGRIALRLNFVRETVNRRPLDKLGRVGAVRQRKEQVHEMNGHQFVEKKFYNIMKCAYCGDFLVANGYQCEDCQYTCHPHCFKKVVTKCITRASSDSDAEELKHKIPHRFESISSMGANWCCHCGYMLPLRARNTRKCLECGITCHEKCAPLVPNFCGLSMEMASHMLTEIRATTKRKTLESSTSSSTSSPSAAHGSGAVKMDPSESLKDQLSYLNLDSSPKMQPPQLQTQGLPPAVPQHSSQSYRPPMTPAYAQQHSPQSSPTQQAQHIMPSPQQGSPRPMYDPRYYQPHMRPADPMSMGMRPPGPNMGMGGVMAPLPPPKQGSPMMAPAPMQPPYYPQQPGHPVQQQQQQQPSPQMGLAKMGLENFEFLTVLGKGNFGKVMLAEDKNNKQLFAIKVLKKRFIIDNDEIESVRSEKRVFQTANRARHPFLIGLHSTFQTESRVYFVMEYVSGGDLMWHIQREPFSERRAKFYACEVLMALEYFHSQNIIYRDLKLDNIMLGTDGHIKLADYGLCKENMGWGITTGTFCGTPEFMAPEILLEQKYGRAVDWWAYGVLIYEMLLGQSPFRGEDEDEIFDAILEDDILYPINMPKDSVSICQHLLTRDPIRRLGSSDRDAAEIRAHPFFMGVNWDDMLAKRVPPPFMPSIQNPHDTSNFDEEFTRERPQLTPVDTKLTRIEQQEFTSFSYVADWASGGSQARW